MIFARMFLKESFGVYEAVMLIFTVSGVISVVNPVNLATEGAAISAIDHMIGCLLSLLNAVTLAIMVVVFRKLKHFHLTVLLLWGAVSATMMSLILVSTVESVIFPTTFDDILASIAAATFTILGRFTLTLAT